jgi:hypothetical protein
LNNWFWEVIITYTTKADFELFKKECWKWINRLGLHSWEYSFVHADIDANGDCTSFRNAKRILIRFAKSIIPIDKTKSFYIKEIAQHEVFHVLLENLYHQAFDRSYCDEDYRIEEHAVIHKLQKAFKGE